MHNPSTFTRAFMGASTVSATRSINQSFKRSFKRAATALGVSVLLLAGTAHAVPDAQFLPAFELFIQANKGESGAVEKAAEAFEALLKAEPTNPVLMAYTGSLTSMKATTTALPWKKMSYAEDGMAMLDKSLALLTPAHDAPLQHGTPAALEVRFTAASTFLAVPAFMNRAARGNKLLADVLASPLLAKAPVAFQGNVFMRAGNLASQDKRPDDARKYFGEVVKLNAPQADAAKAKLAAL